MRKLSEDFRRMLDALAHQDAAEYLPMRDKYRQLGIVQPRVPAADGAAESAATRRRVALLGDGRAAGGHLDYAIDACRRQRAGLDIVLHGAATRKPAHPQELSERLRRQGIDARVVKLESGNVQALNEYVSQHPSLLLVVAPAADALARAFTESTLSRGQRLYVPMVMIQDGPAPLVPSMSFA